MSDDDFLSRWSRRKRAVSDDEKRSPGLDPGPHAKRANVDGEVPGQARDDLPVDEPQTEEEEADLLARLDLPVPESLKPGDDFSRFMADHVPEFLRRRALKVLWRSNPVLANLDGLNDYDDDFNSPELTKKVLATGYKVGRGFLSAVTEDKPVEATAPEPDEQEPEPEVPEETAVISGESDAPPEQVAAPPEDAAVQRPRRMRFET